MRYPPIDKSVDFDDESAILVLTKWQCKYTAICPAATHYTPAPFLRHISISLRIHYTNRRMKVSRKGAKARRFERIAHQLSSSFHQFLISLRFLGAFAPLRETNNGLTH